MPLSKLSKADWLEKYGGQALLDKERFDVVPCENCGDPACRGWRVEARRGDPDLRAWLDLRGLYPRSETK